MDALLLGFAVVFLAEVGDKSQLIALTFASRGRPVAVLLGLAVAAAAIHAISVAVGAALSTALPTTALRIVAGVLFLGFALWALLDDDAADDEVVVAAAGRRAARSVALAAGSAFLVAELGDKTMLATVALASSNGALGTWLGATAGTVAADALAVVAGHQLGRRLSARALRLGSAAAFAGFGLALLAGLV